MEQREGYKKTKIGWIPEDWDVEKLGHIGEFMKGKGIAKKDLIEDGIPCVRYGEIYTVHHWVLKDFHSFISSETALQSTKILKNDILFAGSGETVEEIGKAVAYLDDGEAYAGGDTIILRPGKVNSAFLSASLETEMSNKQKRKLGQGNSVVHIYPAGLKKLLVPLPPLPEQQKIASILTTVDDKISSIDQQIQQTEQLKKGLMEKLLTEGIGHTEFKDTKIGRIPKDWDVKSIGELCKVKGRIGYRGYTTKDLVKEGKGALAIGATQISINNRLDFSNPVYISWEKYFESPEIMCVIGDVLIVQRGSSIGKVAIVDGLPEKATINPSMILLKNARMVNNFLFFSLNSPYGKKNLIKLVSTTSIPMISQKQVSGINIPVPPLQEQKQIASILSTVDEKIDILQSKKTSYTTLKKGLMAQLLTGQMRVEI